MQDHLKMRKVSKPSSDPVLGNCEYEWCGGKNSAVSEIWYKRICRDCFGRLVKETHEALQRELNKDDES